PGHILPGAGARIDETTFAETGEGLAVKRHPFALAVRPKRSPAIRPFLPMKSEPPQIFQHGRHEFRLATRGIEILVAQYQHPAVPPRPFLRVPECPRMS